MEFGLFSESGYRQNPTTAQAYAEDVFEIVMGDRLGFSEVWIAEPNSVKANTVTNANFLICQAAPLTRRIRFGTGIRQLPFLNPIDVVQEANVCDHLTRGRYMFGYGGTRVASLHQGRQRGIVDDHFDPRAMTYEAIDLIMKCWRNEEPFDFEGKFYRGQGIHVLPRPFQKPHPPVATACSGAVETLEIAATNGFIPLMGRGNDKAEEIREWAHTYLDVVERVGRPTSRRPIHATHIVYISDSESKAIREARPGLTHLLESRKRDSAVFLQSRIPPGGTLDDLTFDYMLDQGYFWVGDPESIRQRIEAYYRESGGFGTLLVSVGIPVATRRKRVKSLRLFMERVAPKLAHLDPDGAPIPA